MNEDPAPFPEKLRADSPALVTVVLHCLEKEPGERFQSARDLAFALGVLGGEGARSSEVRDVAATADLHDDLVSFRRLTFRRGTILRARFTPDGFAFVYGGAWEGQRVEPFWVQIGNAEGRSLGHPGTDVLAVSAAGDLALCLKRRHRTAFLTGGTLARQPMGGGAPRQLLQNVDEADWSPDGTGLAIVRDANGMSRLEFPVGSVLFETTGWVSHPRFARDGKSIAFIHHDFQNNDGGSVMLVDLEGRARVLSPDWGTIRGLAWSPDGQEVWFTAHREGAGRNLISVDLAGRERHRLQVPGQLCIQDVFPDGRVLLTHSMERQVVLVQTPGESQPRDLSWMDWTLLRDISSDGQWVLLVESGEGGGSVGAILMRPTDGSAAVNLGEGNALAFSPDVQWVVAITQRPGHPGELMLLPTGVGEPRRIDTRGVSVRHGQWVPDGKSLIVAGTREGDRLRLWRLPLDGGELVPVGPGEGVRLPYYISPDGRFVAAREGEKPAMIYPIDGGEPTAIPGLRPDEEIQPWTMESGALLVTVPGEMPALIHRIDLETGVRSPFREIAPPDASGVWSLRAFRFMPDGQTFGYTYSVQFDDLYLVDRIP
jgi:Tol biopolymer transport system component